MSAPATLRLSVPLLLASLILTVAVAPADACRWGLCRHCRDGSHYSGTAGGGNSGGGGSDKPGDNPDDLLGNSGSGTKKPEKSSDGLIGSGSEAEMAATVKAIAPLLVKKGAAVVFDELLRRLHKDGKLPDEFALPAPASDLDKRLNLLEGRVQKLEDAAAPPPKAPVLPAPLEPAVDKDVLELAKVLSDQIRKDQEAAKAARIEKLKSALTK